MIKKEYDAIVIGGGIRGSAWVPICSAPACRRRFSSDGTKRAGVSARECTAPGFMHNHAQYMEFLEWMPFFHDFELAKSGRSDNLSGAQFGIPFSDGRPPIILYNIVEENYEQTHKSISVYSKKDADTWIG